ncbi:TIR domain-containing protein [Saccharopolyspora antimicrobica]|uniref:TIR domain-containing protein n=1 Tax=Saccharopolyspora antimicrobica TaxID=455193 RepID=A0A1I5CS25_9PSEU|nr:toll/interleukin-1 receptor domain-containing protein [Saccharopolyspora antimicrobica]RKT88764.1 TIR domain-containing protein [Saccharopolyspora antimicrobica]SFN89789.1 TIR domain-containing protein [Saccharopolyspora antimicrobica]
MTGQRYHAFISYHSPARREAKRLKHVLHAIAKRHDAGADFAVYLDTSDLRPGSLGGEIRSALAQSRCLIVLLDRTTVRSSWVAQEIELWLAGGGSPQRLFLVRLDPELNLAWDADRGTFADAEALPAPLREVFPDEQKWIDLTGPAQRRDHEALAGLCAALMDIDANEYLLEEARYQRGRRRTITAVAVVMVLLFAVAAVGAVAAVSGQRMAVRKAELAEAQADASEALLTAQSSPTLAIQRALAAANRSDSSTVRSAMLAVSESARRLVRALVYPESETGHPASGAVFSDDNTMLAAWGADRVPGTSALRVWELTTGRLVASITADAAELRDVVFVGNRLVGCSAAGPVMAEIGEAKTARLSSGASCEVHPFAEGVILLDKPQGVAHFVGSSGEPVVFEGVDNVAAHPSARAAAVSGPAGVTAVAGGRRLPVSAPPGWSVRFADGQGGFLLGGGGAEWGVLTLPGGVPAVRTLTVPADAVDVAPLLDGFNRMTGVLAWITADGTIGWTQDDRRTRIADTHGENIGRTPYRTRLEPLAGGHFVAVLGVTATVVRPPGPGRPVFSSPLPDAEVAWSGKELPGEIGRSPAADFDPVIARCRDRTAVMLDADFPGEAQVVGSGAEPWPVDGHGLFSPACDAFAVGRSLSVLPDLGHEPMTLRETLVTDQVVPGPAVPSTGTTRVALLTPGFAIEVLSTESDDALLKPWDVSGEQRGAVTALGEREVFARNEDLLIVGGSGGTTRVPLPEITDLLAAKPDGTGAAVRDVSPGTAQPVWLVDGSAVVPSAACAGRDVTYLPGPAFTSSRADAEAQLPVARTDDGQFIDCRDGQAVTRAPEQEILSYDIGAGTGRIVARSGDRITLTTWSRDTGTNTTTVDGPGLPASQATTSFDESGQLAVNYVPGVRSLSLHQRAGERWNRTLLLATRLPRLVAAQPVDGGTLVLAVGAGGEFELFDAETGRLVASDFNPFRDAGADDVERVAARRVGDALIVSLYRAGRTESNSTIQIPVSVQALRQQLCSIHSAPECAV